MPGRLRKAKSKPHSKVSNTRFASLLLPISVTSRGNYAGGVLEMSVLALSQTPAPNRNCNL